MDGPRGPLAQRVELPELEPLPVSDDEPLGEPVIAPLLLRPGFVLVELPALGDVLVEEPLDPIELPLLDELP